jgi:ectoine hydroxylase-related dioxygenase (phytanoyl-CoA dioxygenase family)
MIQQRGADAGGFYPIAPGEPGEAAIQTLERDGVVLIRGAFDPAWMALLEQAVDRSVTEKGPDSYTVAIPGEAGFFFTDNFMWKKIAEFRRFAFESPAADLAMKLLRSKTLSFYFDFLLVKEPGTSAATPWHQDHSYWPVNGQQICNIWTALDVIPKENGLRFVKGSHRYETLYRAVSFDPKKRHPHEIMERPTPPNFDAGELDPEILSWDMQPGDSLVWYSRTFHSAPGNATNTRRRALSTSWFGDDATYNEIPPGTGPTSRGENLVQGGPMTCDTFPRVR